MYRLIAAIAVIALSLAACGSSSSGSATTDPTVAFCPALDTYAKSLAKLQALPASASLADYTSAVAAAKAALAAGKLVAGPFAGAQLNDLQTAQQQLEFGGSRPAIRHDPRTGASRAAGAPPGRHATGGRDVQRDLQHPPDAVQLAGIVFIGRRR